MKYHRILAAVAGSVWAIEATKGRAVLDFLVLAAAGGRRSFDELEAIVAHRRSRSGQVGAYWDDEFGPVESPEERRLRLEAEFAAATAARGGVAVVSVAGTIVPRGDGMETSGTTSAETIASRVSSAAADPRVGGIVLDIDSYGGNAQGVPEAADAVAAASAVKPVVAVANHAAASAAYWIASAAGELVVTPSGEVGSIGVLSMHEDITRALEAAGIKQTLIQSTISPHKSEMHPQSPLSEDTRAALQARVDAVAERFVGAVARGRGVSRERVLADFGGGRMLAADRALVVGMVDRIGTLDAEIARLAERIQAGRGKPAARSRASASLTGRRLRLA
jgi:signal peptide peptidase SppA